MKITVRFDRFASALARFIAAQLERFSIMTTGMVRAKVIITISPGMNSMMKPKMINVLKSRVVVITGRRFLFTAAKALRTRTGRSGASIKWATIQTVTPERIEAARNLETNFNSAKMIPVTMAEKLEITWVLSKTVLSNSRP